MSESALGVDMLAAGGGIVPWLSDSLNSGEQDAVGICASAVKVTGPGISAAKRDLFACGVRRRRSLVFY